MQVECQMIGLLVEVTAQSISRDRSPLWVVAGRGAAKAGPCRVRHAGTVLYSTVLRLRLRLRFDRAYRPGE